MALRVKLKNVGEVDIPAVYLPVSGGLTTSTDMNKFVNYCWLRDEMRTHSTLCETERTPT